MRRVALSGVVAVALVLGSSFHLTGSAPARPAPQVAAAGATIAFIRWHMYSDEYGDEVMVSKIHLVNSAGGRERPLTSEERGFDWSPDGRSIVFVSTGFDLSIVGVDGSGLRRLPRSDDFWSDPAWSPDGRQIAVSGGRLGDDLIAVNANGTNRRRLASTGNVLLPAWSPDGRRIAFEGSTAPRGAGIYVVNANGARLKRLTRERWCSGEPFSWSPDSRRIAFSCGGRGVEVINADGSDRHLIFPDRRASGVAWSPDGGKLAFDTGPTGKRQIHVVTADGRDHRTLTPRGTDSDGPVWSSDSRRIAFVREDFGSDVWVMNADGSAERQVTSRSEDFFYAADPRWQPTPRGERPSESEEATRQGAVAARAAAALRRRATGARLTG